MATNNQLIIQGRFGCGGSQPPRPTFGDHLDLIRCNLLYLQKDSRRDAVLFANVPWESRGGIMGLATTYVR